MHPKLSPKTCERRWQAACEEVKRLNAMMEKGYLLIQNKSTIIQEKFEIRKRNEGYEEIVSKVGPGSYLMWFINSADWDNGMYMTVKEIRKMFRTHIKVYREIRSRK